MRTLLFANHTLVNGYFGGKQMITSIHEYRNASNSDKNRLSHNSKSDTSGNVVLFSQKDAKKEKARANLLRAAQKIHW
ncbi:TPA: hypothetical protein LEL88_001881 [Vibrio cholerae]|uniref:Uncharacterized protein n=3 Tax=Vibrio cholerae TaxID=666 RepID=A0A2V4N5E1_VIBCL|nr:MULTISPECIES: hypothetical protein [Vibrio]EYC47529.1 hypothetical protein AZ32_13495 [Vibrio cholerae O1 biovar El Tor str. L-3226]AFC57048.1 hypothetical protein O3Y_00795 [Vibrio cholerae IEC224]AIT30846.1 hypothetical protein EN18_17785 [Vibrio cholerae]AJZ98712.1 hypothetical protein IR04_05815 [Vibrio cholerae O1 biovar El Tor]AKO73736.1 hypothetical protein EN12_00290 [Vibrio cholerae]